MQIDTSTEMNDLTPIGITVGLVANLMRRFPKTITDFCYRIICAFFGGFIFAPFAISSCLIASEYFQYLKFLNPELNHSVVPFIYCISVMFAEPIITLLTKIFEQYLPQKIKSTLDDNNS